MTRKLAVLFAVLATVVAGCSQPTKKGTFESARPDSPKYPHRCASGARSEFAPTSMDIQDVGKGYRVVGLGRDKSGTPGTPPTSATTTVAWDAPGNKPGGKLGNVLFNAHTWPNGGALGNWMLANTDVGDLITVSSDGAKLCYRVTKRVEVKADADYDDFWVEDGPPQMAMIVCSGRRTGPGEWSHRTIWFATPFFG